MKNYYETLGVSNDATKLEIKKSYFRLIRKFTPEKNEEKFKDIREAYETLIDDSKRLSYDNYHKLPEKYHEEFEEALLAMNDGDEDWAISVFKDIEKELGYTENITELLGDAFLSNGNTGNAIKEYLKLTNKYPNNYVYHLKLGNSYTERGFSNKAEKTIKKCILLDESNPLIWYSLINLYLTFEKFFNKVPKTIEKALNISNKNDKNYCKLISQYFLYDITINDFTNTLQHIKIFEDYINSETVKKEYVIEALIDISIYFLSPDIINYAEKIINLAIKHSNEDDTTSDMINLIYTTIKQTKIFIKYLQDQKRNKDLSNYIRINLYKEICLLNNRQSEFLECFYDEISTLNNIFSNQKKYKTYINYLKNQYTVLYEFKKEFFDSILENTYRNTPEFQMTKKLSGLFKTFDSIIKDIKIDDDYIDNNYIDDDDCEMECQDCKDKHTCEDSFYLEPQKPIYVEKIGRNDPCPCGSGKKYKKCCLNKQ
jgi:curved DNA-binding protein CbpA